MTETFDFNAFSEKYKDLATKNPIAFTEEYRKEYELWELQQKKKKHSEELLASIDIQLCDNLLKDKTKKEALNLIGAYYDIKGK